MEQFMLKLQNKQALKSIIWNDNVTTFSHEIQKKKSLRKTKHTILGAKGVRAEIRSKGIKKFEIHSSIDQWSLLTTIYEIRLKKTFHNKIIVPSLEKRSL